MCTCTPWAMIRMALATTSTVPATPTIVIMPTPIIWPPNITKMATMQRNRLHIRRRGTLPTPHDDDCNICQFLGRPILAVTPFELAETSEHVVPLPADAMPDVQPIVVVATQARAPPGAAFSI